MKQLFQVLILLLLEPLLRLEYITPLNGHNYKGLNPSLAGTTSPTELSLKLLLVESLVLILLLLEPLLRLFQPLMLMQTRSGLNPSLAGTTSPTLAAGDFKEVARLS